jgi:hypothetical protein
VLRQAASFSNQKDPVVTTPTKPNKPNAIALDEKHIAAIDKYFGGLTSLTFAGNTITPAILKATFQDDIDETNALDAAEAQVKQTRVKHKAARQKANATRLQLKTYIVGSYGAQSVQMLEDFGFSAPKSPGKKTVASKATALAKAEATRTARHTMGKKQKAAIKGTVAPEATPAASPAPAGSPTTPATTTK